MFGEFLTERSWRYRSLDRWRSGNPHDPREVSFVDHEADLCDLSMFGNDEFDLFIAQHVIEEIEDYVQALNEIARVMRPGGRALLEIPFDPRRERSERQPPDHFGNVWSFGRDLIDRLRERFGVVEQRALAEGSYLGTLFICGGGAGSGEAEAAANPARTTSASHNYPSRRENAVQGDDGWWSGHKAPVHAIEGYVSWPSVEPGERLYLRVSTRPASRYRVTVHRLGWYDGAGGRTMAEYPANGDLQGFPQPLPEILPGPTIRSCEWPVTDTIPIGTDWPSGQYVARLLLTDGEHEGNIAFVPFVVRGNLERRADILVQMPVTTAQAYNNWGGKSLYPSNSSDEVPAVKVTFERPFAAWHEANLNARWPFIWDVQLIRFLEREGYDVAYTTDLDTHREPWNLLGHPVLMTSGHDEYWSAEMRDAFEAARDAGASLACMGANTCYWQTRFEEGETMMVEYRDAAADPELDPSRKTVRFRDLDPPRPECELWGIQYQDGMTTPDQPARHYRLDDASVGDSWLDGTGFERGVILEGLVGYEWDAFQVGSIPNETTVFFHYENELSNADAIRHRTAAGGLVFAAGSLQFSWGLDDWARPGHADSRLQRFMRNALDELIAVGRAAATVGVDGVS